MHAYIGTPKANYQLSRRVALGRTSHLNKAASKSFVTEGVDRQDKLKARHTEVCLLNVSLPVTNGSDYLS